MPNNSIKIINHKVIIKQNSLNSKEQVTSVLNSNSKPNLNLNNGKEMKNRKKRRKGEEGLAAQPLGPASPVRARRPSKQAQATAAARAPSPASCRCHLGPRVSRSLFTRTLLFPSSQSLPADPARQPSPAHLPHAAPIRQPIGGRQRVQSGPGGHARAMALPPPLALRPRNPSWP